MKKNNSIINYEKLFLTIFGLILLVGCRPNLTKSENDNEPAPIQVTDNIGQIPGFYGVTSFTYNKHDYIVFSLGDNQLCVVHDPDCKKCKKINYEEDKWYFWKLGSEFKCS